MSSEEVAKIAQAINSHADALYESWRRRSASRPVNNGSPAPNSEANVQIPNNNTNNINKSAGASNRVQTRRMEDTLELLADPGLTPKLEHLVSNFVRQDREKRQQTIHQISPQGAKVLPVSVIAGVPEITREISPSRNNSNRKPLPKSILAVVKRFEGPDESSSIQNQADLIMPQTKTLVKTAVPGVGNVSRQVLWSQSSNSNRQAQSHANTERVSPIRNTGSSKVTLRPGKVRLIPIEREPSEDTRSRFSPSKLDASLLARLESKKDSDSVDYPKRLSSEREILSLQREEEKLVKALRTGQIVTPPIGPNSNSRIAFAKERIRQSQENPLTQQRLELQKRLPYPSNNLSSALAVQQGKIRFQPGHMLTVNGGDLSREGSDEDLLYNRVSPYRDSNSSGSTSSTNGNNGGGGRQQSLKLSGSSVADRVQLFEKHPGPQLSAALSSNASLKDSSTNNNSAVGVGSAAVMVNGVSLRIQPYLTNSSSNNVNKNGPANSGHGGIHVGNKHGAGMLASSWASNDITDTSVCAPWRVGANRKVVVGF